LPPSSGWKESAKSFFHPDDEGDTFLRNVCSHKSHAASLSQKMTFFMPKLFRHSYKATEGSIALVKAGVHYFVRHSLWQSVIDDVSSRNTRHGIEGL
jgi:hypothetical protein